MKAISVFCGSSKGNDPQIVERAKQLGKTLADNKVTLVYGAAKIGIMGQVAQSCLQNGGNVVGIIPEFLKKKEIVHLGLTTLFTTKTMHERKQKMHELSDGFIALPGGFGTLEELFEILTWAQLGLHKKPIGILNINGYFDDLVNLCKTMCAKGFLKNENLELLLIDVEIKALMTKMNNFKPKVTPKWIMADSDI